MGFSLLAPRIGLGAIRTPVLLAYLVFMIYTWIATPLVRLWVRWRPAR